MERALEYLSSRNDLLALALIVAIFAILGALWKLTEVKGGSRGDQGKGTLPTHAGRPIGYRERDRRLGPDLRQNSLRRFDETKPTGGAS